jgi:hypothetical protein
MVNKERILQIAQKAKSSKGFFDYRDFIELRPIDEPGGHWLRPIKKLLLDAGFQCHEIRFRAKWWGKCGYRENRTHFH